MTDTAYDTPLSAEDMTRQMDAIISGRVPAEEISRFLSGLARRGETAEEIAAAVGVLRSRAVRLPLTRTDGLCDTCGTGGDGQGTINVSTLAALIASAAGVRIVKHGNRAASSRCGSADLLEALGLNLDAAPEQVARSVDEAGFGFCFAPRFHPAMKVVAPIRKSLGIRTIFNLIGPLANPAPLTFQLVGVSDRGLLQPMAAALVRLGIRHGLVVHGADGLDEVTTTGHTEALEVRDGRVEPQRIDPSAWGVPRAARAALQGGDAAANAAIARRVLRGEAGAARDIILVNAGCALYVAGAAASIPEGITKAAAAVDAGRAAQLLETVVRISHAG